MATTELNMLSSLNTLRCLHCVSIITPNESYVDPTTWMLDLQNQEQVPFVTIWRESKIVYEREAMQNQWYQSDATRENGNELRGQRSSASGELWFLVGRNRGPPCTGTHPYLIWIGCLK